MNEQEVRSHPEPPATYFRLHRYIMRSTGLWPEDDHLGWFLYRNLLLAHLAAYVVMEVTALHRYWGDLSHATINACVMLILALGMVKAAIFVHMKKPLLVLMNELTAYAVSKNAKEKSILSAAARHSRLATLTLLVVYVIVVVTWNFLPLANYLRQPPETRFNSSDAVFSNFPIIVVYPFPVDSPSVYGGAYSSQILCAVTFGAIHIATDTFYLCLVINICAQIQILYATLENLGYDHDEDFTSSTTNFPLSRISDPDLKMKREQIMQQDLVQCVKHHQKIIGFVAELQTVMSPFAMAQFVCSMIIICLSGFGLAVTRDWVSMFRYSIYFNGASFQLLILCWYGQELIEKSQGLQSASMSCNWLDAPSSFRQAVRFIMLRAQKPLAFTGGKFYVVCLKTFMQLLNVSYSFFAVLRQVNDSDVSIKH